MGWGNLFENRLEYAVGVFDGPRNSYQDFNNAKDIMAFVDYRPFFQTESALKFLSVGGSVDEGDAEQPAGARGAAGVGERLRQHARDAARATA